VAVLAAGLVVLVDAEDASARTEPGGPWLARLNQLRVWAGMEPVVEDPHLSYLASEAAIWLGENRMLTHYPPGHAPQAARDGAAQSNLYAGRAGVEAIDGWTNSLGHGYWNLHPGLRQVGYGTHFAHGYPTTALNVVGGEQAPVDPDDGPWTFPTDGAEGVDLLWGHSTLITRACGWSDHHLHGPTLRVISNPGENPTKRTAAVAVNGQLVPVCVLDHRDDEHLEWAGTIAIIPARPLPKHASVRFFTIVDGEEVHAGFTTVRLPIWQVYRDLDPRSPTTPAVDWADRYRITTGVRTGEFGPNAPVARGQWATFMWRTLDRPPGDWIPFTDVPHHAHYFEPVRWLYDAGLATGCAADRFCPQLSTSRAHAVTMLWRHAGSPAPDAGARFEDVPPGAYYEPAVRWATHTGITTGTTSTRFEPNRTLSRAQAVTILWRYQQRGS
jgi:hypothetical protein